MGSPSEHQVEEKDRVHEKSLAVAQAKERLFKGENHSAEEACSLQDWFAGEFLLPSVTSLKNYWAMKAFLEMCWPLKDKYSS